LKSVSSFRISEDNKYMHFLLISNIFYKLKTKIQRNWQKIVWSIDHTALNVAPPLTSTKA
jgi:hypothetical protein